MKQLKQTGRAGLLATILLLITLATTFAADTGEIEVTEGVDGQPANRIRNTAVAMDGLGNAVVVWSHQEGVNRTVYARRYDSSGASAALIPVETLSGSAIVGYADVAMNDSGAFVVAWTQMFADDDGFSVHAALYDASGNVVRAPFQVNTSEIGDQWAPSVAMDDSGNFLVAWDQKDSVFTSVEWGVYAQRYNNTGQPDGGELLVNTSPEAGVQHQVDVSMAGDGRAIAVWHTEASEDSDAIYGQRFKSDGSPNAGEIQISPASDFVSRPAVAMDDSGAFVAVWDDGSSGVGIHRFNADGSSADSGFIGGAGEWPDIAMDDNGNFAVVWQSGDGAAVGTYAALFDSTGTQEGDNFRVNVRTDEYEEFPAVAMSDTDHYVFAWVRSEILPQSAPVPEGIFARFLSGRPANTAPAVFAGNYFGTTLSSRAHEGEPFTLSAASASDPDGDPLSYAWSVDDPSRCTFGDSTVLNPTITCTDDGDFTVTLEVSDGITTNSSEGALRVYNVAPDITISGDSTVAAGDTYILTLGEIVDPGDDTVSAITVIWGDGILDSYTTTGDVTHVYDETGDFFLRVDLTDEDGTFSNRDNLSLSVTAANSAPVANDDDYSTDEDTTLNVAAPGILDDDSDADGDPLTAALESNVSHGSLVLNTDGSFTYTPDANYHGPDSFTYTANDGELASNVATVTIDVVSVNDAPVADAGGTYAGDEGSAIALSGDASDVDGDALSYTWSSDGPCTFSDASALNPMLTCDDDGSFTATLTVDDGTTTSSSNAAVTVTNVAPTIDLSGDGTTDEGASYALTLGAVTDPGEDTVTEYVVHWGDGNSDSYTSGGEVSHIYDDGPASHTISVDLVDEDGTHAGAGSIAVTVDNVAPTIDFIEAPTDPIAIDAQPVWIQIFFSDPGADTHETVIDWDDGASDTLSGDSPVSADHTYAEAGVYTLNITVTDDDGGADSAIYEYVVIYDPDGGFVTGRGRIYSQAGWCYLDDVCEGAEGDARFGFVSRYNEGATVPTGRTDFVFRAGNLDFESTSYKWLVVNQGGTNAQFRGEGLINGSSSPGGGDYQFMIWAGEGTGSGGEDTFRIQIWYEAEGTETVVYDNGFDQPIDSGKIKVQAN